MTCESTDEDEVENKVQYMTSKYSFYTEQTSMLPVTINMFTNWKGNAIHC